MKPWDVVCACKIENKKEGLLWIRCGRVNRLARQFPHSGAFLTGSSIWLHILGLLYTFSFLNFSHIINLLTILFFNFELQVEGLEVPEDFQMHSTLQSCQFSMHHAPSRFLSNTSLSARRTGCWFHFYFPFYEYFCSFVTLSLKIQDLDTFLFSWLVNIRLDELICWTVGSNSIIQVHSALVGWPGDVLSIECPDDRLFPETSPAVDVPR
jgi:hypothetical protein